MQRLLIIVTCLFVLSACSTEGDRRRAEYLDADYLTRLELPPDLIYEDKNASRTQLVLPKPTEKALKQYKAGLDETKLKRIEADTGDTLNSQVAPVFDGLRLKSEGGLYWLEIDKSTKAIWPVLIAFWQHEGVQLSKAEPLLGIIETDWVSQYQLNENDNFFSKLAVMLDKDKSDRFRMRVLAGKLSSQTKIVVAHSGLQNVVSGEGDDENFHFSSRASESDLEVEILSRLLVFMGLSQQDSTALLAGYRPYTQRAIISETNNKTVVMTGSMEFVWQRTLRALDRLGLDVAVKNEAQGELKILIQKLSNEKIGGEKDEVAESSFIMQWFTGEGKDAANDEDRQFILKLKPLTKSVNIQLQNLEREPADSVLAEQVVKGLLIELN